MFKGNINALTKAIIDTLPADFQGIFALLEASGVQTLSPNILSIGLKIPHIATPNIKEMVISNNSDHSMLWNVVMKAQLFLKKCKKTIKKASQKGKRTGYR